MLSLLLAAALCAATDAPVTHVTVYSDRARVTRTLELNVSNAQSVELPLLQESVDPNSVRVEATGAEVRRVDIQNANEDEFPTDEAKKLLAQIRTVEDSLAKARGEKAADEAQVALLARIHPMTPQPEPQRNVPKLNATGWNAAVAFAATETQKLQDRSRALDKQIDTLEDEYQELSEKAQLMGGVGKRRGLKVTANLAGSGSAKLTLTYVTARARWYPLYELQLLPDTGKVQISFSGLVSQETGEDWNDAQLVLSTAVPANASVLPKLPTWKIGERERFIPTPYPISPQIRPPPPTPPLPTITKWEDVLRQRLLAEIGQIAPQRPVVTGNAYGSAYGQAVGGKDRRKVAEAPPEVTRQIEEEGEAVQEPMEAPKMEDKDYGEKMPMAPSPPPRAQSYDAKEEVEVTASKAPSSFFGFSSDEAQGEIATQGVSLAPPRGWVPPTPPPDSPAALAGGYDLAFPSLRPETIASGKGMRRVPLFTEQWPVTVERKLFPAVAKEAYLVAEIKSPSKQVLPAGNANLFVGEDPAGNARLPLVSPGEAFTLPLGLDRAIKPVRNVKVSQAEKGFIGKDEITEYVVTTEISNPYSVPIATRIMDQWPVTSNKDLKVELVKTEPWAIQDKVKGTLEWRITIPPRGKQTVTFVYTLRRPKGWLLYQ